MTNPKNKVIFKIQQISPRKDNATSKMSYFDKNVITSSIQASQLPPLSRNLLNKKNAKSKKNSKKKIMKFILLTMKRFALSGIKSNLLGALFSDELYLEK